MMKITYIGHSGFFVEMEDAAFYLIITKERFRKQTETKKCMFS